MLVYFSSSGHAKCEMFGSDQWHRWSAHILCSQWQAVCDWSHSGWVTNKVWSNDTRDQNQLLDYVLITQTVINMVLVFLFFFRIITQIGAVSDELLACLPSQRSRFSFLAYKDRGQSSISYQDRNWRLEFNIQQW